MCVCVYERERNNAIEIPYTFNKKQEESGEEFFWMSKEFVYGVASISRLLKIIGLFCKRAL